MMTATSLDALPLDPLSRATAGEQAAFAELVRAHESMVFSIAWHVLRDRDLAQEVAQDVFLQLFRSLAEIRSPEHLLFWLRRVAGNRCIDVLRRRNVRPVPLEEIDLANQSGADPFDPILARRLRELLATLPTAQRVAVTLRYQEDLDPREIAAILDLPVNTVKSHLRRALASMRAGLGEPAQGADDESR